MAVRGVPPVTLLLWNTNLPALQLCLQNSNVLVLLVNRVHYVSGKILVLTAKKVRMKWMKDNIYLRKEIADDRNSHFDSHILHWSTDSSGNVV